MFACVVFDLLLISLAVLDQFPRNIFRYDCSHHSPAWRLIGLEVCIADRVKVNNRNRPSILHDVSLLSPVPLENGCVPEGCALWPSCRGSPQAFASDDQALAWSSSLMQRGLMEELPYMLHLLVLLPSMHSERLEDQDVSGSQRGWPLQVRALV